MGVCYVDGCLFVLNSLDVFVCGEYLVDDVVFQGLFCGEDVVVIDVVVYLFWGVVGVCCQCFFELGLYVEDFCGLDFDVGGLIVVGFFYGGLVDQYVCVWKCEVFVGGICCEQYGGSGCCLVEYYGLDLWCDVLYCVVDGCYCGE